MWLSFKQTLELCIQGNVISYLFSKWGFREATQSFWKGNWKSKEQEQSQWAAGDQSRAYHGAQVWERPHIPVSEIQGVLGVFRELWPTKSRNKTNFRNAPLFQELKNINLAFNLRISSGLPLRNETPNSDALNGYQWAHDTTYLDQKWCFAKNKLGYSLQEFP